MKIIFNLEYRTRWGEHLVVFAEGTDENNPIELSTADGLHWEGSTRMTPRPGNEPLRYGYGVMRGKECIRREYGALPHRLCLDPTHTDTCLTTDRWKELPKAAFLFSSAFNGVHLDTPETPAPTAPTEHNRVIELRAVSPCLRTRGQRLGVSGNIAALGCWNPQQPMLLSEVTDCQWAGLLTADADGQTIEYKFVACNALTGEVEEWENRSNRQLHLPTLEARQTTATPEEEVYFDSTFRRVAGTAIPVFALRSRKSFGVGDFGDLNLLIDWAVSTRQQAIQILPINDTTDSHTWRDSYPYNAISIYALHPLYIDLTQTGTLADKQAAEAFEAERCRLNALPQMDYERVMKLKRAYLKALYAQDGEQLLHSAAFNRFFAANRHWLVPYSAFSHLRDSYGTADFNRWPAYSTYHAPEIEALCQPDSPVYAEIAFYYYMQYHLHIQLLAAADYARQHGVIFKGDIPIGISRCSVEAWTEPHYFNMNGQAGAPPDAFSTNGQNWGFPTYNWEVMEQDHYRWWQRRFKKMAEYFTAYRIDHILGFFRIWEIPLHSVHGLLGQFAPALPMTPDEINSFGLPFDADLMTRPYIDQPLLEHYFGKQAEWVKDTFLTPAANDRYHLRPAFDTQRKIEAWFATHEPDHEDSRRLKEGLYALISDVLFVPDRRTKGLYHPRIAAQNDYLYTRLSAAEQEAFNRLYEHYFYQRHNQFWYDEAMKKLPILTGATSMLVCGEDLGMVPESVPWVMKQLQILSLDIERMPKAYGHAFGDTTAYPYRSVCTISTHDTSTLRGWWEEDPALTERYYHEVMYREGKVPATADAALCEEVVSRHLQSPSLLCILTLQDWLATDAHVRCSDVEAERINVPANPRHYWRYRMHLTLEELIANRQLTAKIRRLVEESGRG